MHFLLHRKNKNAKLPYRIGLIEVKEKL